MPKTKKKRNGLSEVQRYQHRRLTRAEGSATGVPSTNPPRGGAAASFLTKITKLFLEAADAQKAVGMKKYMRDQFEFYGIQAPCRRAISKQVFQQLRNEDPETIREILELLWQQNEREYQHIGLDITSDRNIAICGSSKEEYTAAVGLLRKLITTKSWWDTVDCLAGAVGTLAKQDSALMNPIIEKWIKDENMWIRRVAIIHQLQYKEDTDKEKLFRFCRLCAHEEDFFIRKAIGWALRQYSKCNPKDVRKFVEEHDEKLSTLSKREALKYA